MWSVLTGQRSGKRWKKVRNKCDPNRRRPACNDERWPASLGKRRGVWNVRRNLRKASRTISGDSQDLTLHTMLPDGVTTVRQTLGRGFERNRLFARPTNPCCAIRVILTATQPGNRVRVVFFFAPLPARDIALAPDGRTAAIVSYSETARKNVIWIYEVGSQGVRSLADTEGAD